MYPPRADEFAIRVTAKWDTEWTEEAGRSEGNRPARGLLTKGAVAYLCKRPGLIAPAFMLARLEDGRIVQINPIDFDIPGGIQPI